MSSGGHQVFHTATNPPPCNQFLSVVHSAGTHPSGDARGTRIREVTEERDVHDRHFSSQLNVAQGNSRIRGASQRRGVARQLQLPMKEASDALPDCESTISKPAFSLGPSP